MITGRDLRAAREAKKLSLREMAKLTGRDLGDLSRKERGERPVSPALIHDYERVLKSSVAATPSDDPVARNRATVDDMERRALLAAVAVASVGAAMPEPLACLVDGLDAAELPSRVGLPEVQAVEAAAVLYMKMDLAHGGGMAASMARASLRWADGLFAQPMTDETRGRLSSAVGLLADRLGWAMFDVGDIRGARHILEYGLNSAARGPDRDLRAHIMLDLSTVITDSGDAPHAIEVLRMALGDDRLSSAERANLHAVCARHCGTAGERQAGLRQVALAEDALTRSEPTAAPAWARRITVSAGHHDSALGLALFEIGEDERARQRLCSALEQLDVGRTRTGLRCRTRLAILHLRAGERAAGERELARALADAEAVRSRRITADLEMVAQEASRLGYRKLAADVNEHLRLSRTPVSA